MHTNPIEPDHNGPRREQHLYGRQRRPGKTPEAYLVVIECDDEAEQRAYYECLRKEGVKVRLMVI